MSAPIGEPKRPEPERKPDRPPPPVHKFHHKTRSEQSDVLETSNPTILGRSLNLVPDKPVLSQVNAFIQGNQEIQKMIKAHIENIQGEKLDVLDIKQFYQIIAKLFPIASSFLSQIKGDEAQEVIEKLTLSLTEFIAEIKNELRQNPTSENFPQELTDILLTGDLQNPETYARLVHSIDKLSTAPTNLLARFSSVVGILNATASFPPQHKPEVMMLMMASATINSEGFFGEQLHHLKQGLTDFTLNLTAQMHAIPEDKILAAKHYLSSVFDQFLLSGILMGKTLALKANGKMIDTNDPKDLAQTLLESKQEIKIFDLVPFSFLAFFVPFQDLEKGSSNVVKLAKEALINVIRLMLRLVFMLLAVITGGAKLMKNGIDILLKGNADIFIQTLNDLIFAMKKVSEAYGVKVTYQMKFAEIAREALQMETYAEFWENVLKIFSKSDLSALIKETKDADPLYEAISSLFKVSNFDEASIHLKTQG